LTPGLQTVYIRYWRYTPMLEMPWYIHFVGFGIGAGALLLGFTISWLALDVLLPKVRR
jgi:hypothetical protein